MYSTKFSEDNLSQMAIDVHNALVSNPINEKVLVKILSSTTNEDRQGIRTLYKKKYLRPIQNDLKDYLSYKLKDLCIAMFDTPYEYDARELHKALHSFINDDRAIVEILVSRSKSHLEIVNNAYNQFYQISLREDLKKETTDEYTQFLLALLDLERPQGSTISVEDAFELAKQLKNKGIKFFCKDVNSFKNTFLQKSREDLILISRAYCQMFGKNLYDTIESEGSGKNKRVLKSVLFATINLPEFFADRIFKAIEGLGTDNNALNRILIARSEIDMYALRDYYYIERRTDICDDIKGDASGAYGEILINLSQK